MNTSAERVEEAARKEAVREARLSDKLGRRLGIERARRRDLERLVHKRAPVPKSALRGDGGELPGRGGQRG